MPFALVFIGLLLIVSGAKDTYKQFGAELVEDFTGDGNFTWWIVSIGAVGSLGYVTRLQTFSRMFMALIIIAMLIANRGVFNQATAALQAGPEAPAKQPTNDAQGFPIKATPAPTDSGSDPQANFAKVVDVAIKLFI